jgi:ribosomal protein S21
MKRQFRAHQHHEKSSEARGRKNTNREKIISETLIAPRI